MKTQVSIEIKDASILTKLSSTWLWFIRIFKKGHLNVLINTQDGTPQKMVASKEPYVLDFEPGEHYIIFKDPYERSKNFMKKTIGALFGAAFSGGAGGSFLVGGAMGAEGIGNTVHDGIAEFTLNEGDLLKLSAKEKLFGGVKVKILN